MTANEVADELEACFTKADWLCLEAASQLRQMGLAESIIKQQELRIAQLELSATPVAWMVGSELCRLKANAERRSKDLNEPVIALYRKEHENE